MDFFAFPFLFKLPLLLLLCFNSKSLSSIVRMDGDYTVAGLFPIHRGSTVNPKLRPVVDICESMGTRNLHSYHLMQAMRFAVDEINNSSQLLPSVTLGYEIYDTCSQSATLYAMLRLLSAQGGGEGSRWHVPVASNYTGYLSQAVAVIGPDSSELAITTATLLGIFLIPQISYEASSSMLSLKRFYPSFLRTIPSDREQVEALLRLLKAFNWTWVTAVGSNNAYGRQSLQMLHEVATKAGICFAYQGFITLNEDVGSQDLTMLVQALIDTTAKVTIVFANKQSATAFFEEVIRQNVTGKVWLGTEDWSLAPQVRDLAGIHSVGTVIGVSLKRALIHGIDEFEAASRRTETSGAPSSKNCSETCSRLCASFQTLGPENGWKPSDYDLQGAFNVYLAVHAVAHGLHRLLDCQTGTCHKETVYPWQLLKEVKKVNFSLNTRRIYFDPNGDPLVGYDLVMWKWTDQNWSYNVIGSFNRNPDQLILDWHQLQWHTMDNQVPVSVCSKNCEKGEQKVQQGIHPCCFECVGCLPGTFLNRSDLYTCQKCRMDQWAPARSEICFHRALLFLPWEDHISCILLTATTLLLLSIVGTAAVFAKNLQTPVVKSAGGLLCFAMLSSLACATLSLYCYFGIPGQFTCLLRMPVYSIDITVCLSCMAARSFQVVFIFKLSSRAPGLYGAWKKYHGPNLLITASMSLQGTITLLQLIASPEHPHQNYDAFEKLILLECKGSSSLLTNLGMTYNSLLGVICFAVTYLGKDLPNSYSEAKCISFSLLIYFISLIAFTTTTSVYKGRYLSAVYMVSLLFTLAGFFGSYFIPKVYVILFKSELNTSEHFQMSIQTYTRKINTAN